MKIVAFDVWQQEDLAEFSLCLKVLQAEGHDVVDLYIDPARFPSFERWRDAMLVRLRREIGTRGGEFALLGFCAGGRVALEVANVLTREGTPPSFVGLVETWIRSPLIELDRDLYRHYRVRAWIRLRQQLLWLLVTPGGDWRALLRWQVRNSKKYARVNRHSESARDEQSRSVWRLMHFTHDRMFPVVTSFVHLFNSQGSIDEHLGDPSLGLAPYLRGGYDVHVIPGDHLTCTKEPNQSHLIEQITHAAMSS